MYFSNDALLLSLLLFIAWHPSVHLRRPSSAAWIQIPSALGSLCYLPPATPPFGRSLSISRASGRLLSSEEDSPRLSETTSTFRPRHTPTLYDDLDLMFISSFTHSCTYAKNRHDPMAGCKLSAQALLAANATLRYAAIAGQLPLTVYDTVDNTALFQISSQQLTHSSTLAASQSHDATCSLVRARRMGSK